MTAHLSAAPPGRADHRVSPSESLLSRAVKGAVDWVGSRFAVSDLEWNAKATVALAELEHWRAETQRLLLDARLAREHVRLREHLRAIEAVQATAVQGPQVHEVGACVEQLTTADLLFGPTVASGMGTVDMTVDVMHRCLQEITFGGAVREPGLHELLEMARVGAAEPDTLVFDAVHRTRQVRCSLHRHRLRFVVAAAGVPLGEVLERLRALQVLAASSKPVTSELFGVITDDTKVATSVREQHYLVYLVSPSHGRGGTNQ